MFYNFGDVVVTAFFTRSSAANIPVNMNLCEKLGLDKEYYSVSIPLGACGASGDVIFCATAEFREWQKQGKELPF